MNFLVTVRIALRALSRNKMRGFLTVLGVVIGIAAVTTIVSLSQSASALVQNEFQSLGTNVMWIQPRIQRRGGIMEGNVPHLTASDAEAIQNECPTIRAVSPMVFTSGQVVYGSSNWNVKQIEGVGVDYLTVRNWQLRHGGFFSERDVASSAKVCVIGYRLVEKLFQTTNPIDETIRIKRIPFRVVGVLERKGVNMAGFDQDDTLLVPYTTAKKRLQGSTFFDLGAIAVSASSGKRMSDAENEITYLLRDRHRLKPGQADDFWIVNTEEIASRVGTVTGVLTLLVASVAGISLFVGGIGIMNIMLVSVTERTREIGIRKAVGAKARHILRQFLVEAVVLSSLGGILGFAMGTGASMSLIKGINYFTGGVEWPIVVSFPAAIVALVISAGIGIFFGVYPAWKASRLDPIEALRHE